MILALISSVSLIHLAIWLCIVGLFVVIISCVLQACGVVIPPQVKALIGIIILLIVLLVVLQNFGLI